MGEEAGFGITLKEVRELMELRKSDALEAVKNLGGVAGVAQKLKTSPTEGNIIVCILNSEKQSQQEFLNDGLALSLLNHDTFSIITGLTGEPADLTARVKIFGKNTIPPAPAKSFCELLVEAVQDLTLIILLISASISLVLWAVTTFTHQEGNNVSENEEEHGWIDSVAIYASVAVVVFVTAGNDYTKEKQFRGLQSKIEGEHSFAVIRNGNSITINVADIVVGDIIQVGC